MTGLRRTLGLPSLVFYGIGLILGAGIYSVIGAAAAEAGRALWMSFALGAVAALLTGLSYAELGTAYPKAGAEFIYLREAFPRLPWLAELVAMILLVAAASIAATVSLAFGGYLRSFVAVPAIASAVVLLGLATAVNVRGMRESSWMNVAFTLIEVLGLLLFVALGASRDGFAGTFGATPGTGILAGASLVFFAYLGFEELANLVEEAKDPARDLPRAIVLSVAISTILYILVAVSAVTLATPEELAASQAPLADAARDASPAAARALGAIALFATANTALIALIATSRMMLGMARGGGLPRVLATVSSRGTPWIAALVALALALLVLPLGGVKAVAGLASFGALLGFSAVNVAVIVLRLKKPRLERPFRLPFAIRGVPLIPVLGVAATLLLALRFERAVYIAGAVAVAVAGAIIAARSRLR